MLRSASESNAQIIRQGKKAFEETGMINTLASEREKIKKEYKQAQEVMQKITTTKEENHSKLRNKLRDTQTLPNSIDSHIKSLRQQIENAEQHKKEFEANIRKLGLKPSGPLYKMFQSIIGLGRDIDFGQQRSNELHKARKKAFETMNK